MEVCSASLNDLVWYIESGNAVYTGGTKRDPKKRAYEHSRNGYSGTLYYCSTSNMKRTENKLIDMCGDCNNRMRSGLPQKSGYVYVIVEDSGSGSDCCIIL
eukprot:40062_1